MAVHLTASIILASALLSFFAVAVAAFNFLFDCLGRRPKANAWLPALCQYLGVFCAVIGFTFWSLELAIIAGLLLALRLLLASRDENTLPQAAEAAVLAAALFGLGSLAIVRGLPLI